MWGRILKTQFKVELDSIIHDVTYIIVSLKKKTQKSKDIKDPTADGDICSKKDQKSSSSIAPAGSKHLKEAQLKEAEETAAERKRHEAQ